MKLSSISSQRRTQHWLLQGAFSGKTRKTCLRQMYQFYVKRSKSTWRICLHAALSHVAYLLQELRTRAVARTNGMNVQQKVALTRLGIAVTVTWDCNHPDPLFIPVCTKAFLQKWDTRFNAKLNRVVLWEIITKQGTQIYTDTYCTPKKCVV